jgi:MurNAc alpha-1-phosphate uridylyltransferase
MKVMLLAAGEGRRLWPLTKQVPKPLLPIGKTTLIERWLDRFAMAGFDDFVVNTWHLGEQVRSRLGDGSDRGVRIAYSPEPTLLETGGGIRHALPLLGEDDFVVISSDTLSDFDPAGLPERLPGGVCGHLVLVNNPPFHPEGDFALDGTGRICEHGQRLTYSGIGVYSPRLFDGAPTGAFKLRLLMDRAIAAGEFTGEHYSGFWLDVGTPERYQAAQRYPGSAEADP